MAARALVASALLAAQRLGANPGLGTTRPARGQERFRFLLLRGFSYLLVYVPDTDPPRIVRVLHTAGDLPAILARQGS